MTPDLRQLGLVAAALAVLAFIGSGLMADPPLPPPSTLAFTQASQTPETIADTAQSTTVPEPVETPTSTTTTAPARTLTVEVHPEEADVVTTLIDADGISHHGDSGLSLSLAGPATVTVEGDGYRPEHLDIGPEVDGTVAVWLDPAGQLVDRRMVFGSGAAPKQVAFTPDSSELWVTLLAGTGLEVYDPLTGELITVIDLPEAGSVEVIFDEAGDTAYVSQMETATVYEIDVGSHEVTDTLETGGSWTKVMLLSPDETTLWASNWVSDDVSEFNLDTGEMVRRISSVPTPRGLAIDPSGSRLYVAGFADGGLDAIDLDTGEGEVIHSSGGALRHLVTDPDRGLIYASDMAADEILVVDTTTSSVDVLATTDRLPNTIDLSPDGRFLAVSNRGRNNPETYYLPGPEWGSILLLDTQSGKMLDAVVGGNQPTGLDISSDGRWLAYSDFLDDRVTVMALPSTQELLDWGGGRSETYRSELQK